MFSQLRIKEAFLLALPVMLAYVSIGIPCGVMGAQAGLSPLVCFFFSVTFYSGAGQFMIPSLFLAGTPLWSIALSVSFVSMRHLLYSAAFVPKLSKFDSPLKYLFAAVITDETFGINLNRFENDETWTLAPALLVNVFSMLSWASANAIGSALGSIIELPIDVMSFGMTAVFICLLVCQSWNKTAVVVGLSSALFVVVLRTLGLGGFSIFLGALLGVIVGVFTGKEQVSA